MTYVPCETIFNTLKTKQNALFRDTNACGKIIFKKEREKHNAQE